MKFPHVQLVMERHNKGAPYGKPLETLAMSEIHVDSRSNRTILMSVEPRIVEDELCLRIQQWGVFQREAMRSPPDESKLGDLAVCAHVLGKYLAQRFLDAYYARQRQGIPSENLLSPSTIHCCITCDTHFQLGIRDLSHGRKALYITKWLSFGLGPCPTNKKWTRHTTWGGKFGLSCEPWVAQVVPKRHLAAAFEEAREGGKTQSEITEEYAALLEGGTFVPRASRRAILTATKEWSPCERDEEWMRKRECRDAVLGDVLPR
jgi:hypothetical protein